MNTMFDLLAAQSPATPPTGTPTGTPPTGGGQFVFLALMVGMIAFMFLTSRSTKKREARKREELYAGLAKNNSVLTVGGVIGTIMSVRDNEVVLKVDETTNTKMTFLKSAIQRTITDGDLGSDD